MILRGFRYKLAPTAEQEVLFRQFSGVCRLVYNLALEQRRDFWRQYRRQTGQWLNYVAQGPAPRRQARGLPRAQPPRTPPDFSRGKMLNETKDLPAADIANEIHACTVPMTIEMPSLDRI